jgi:uncharacterized protein YggE
VKNKRQWLVRMVVTLSLLMAGVIVVTLVNPQLPEADARTNVPSTQSVAVNPASPEPQADTTLPRTITVVGEGKVKTKPDIAQINIGIEILGDTVQEASDQAADAMDAVLAILTAQGVEQKDIQTSGYNVWVERPYGPEGPTGDTLYHVNNTVSVTIRDLDSVGTILDATIEAGANSIYGVTFNVADPSPLMSEGREKAVTDARSKAEELAELNNVAVGEVISISEVIGGAPGYYAGGFRGLSPAEGMGGGGAGPISPGELELTVQLQITYRIQ